MYGKTDNKQQAPCPATLVQNELNSDIASFNHLYQTCLAKNQVFNWLNAQHRFLTRFCGSAEKQVARVCCPFYRSFT